MIVVSAIKDFGAAAYLIRSTSISRDDIRAAFGLVCATYFVFFLVIMALRNYLAALYQIPALSDVLLVISFTFLISPLGVPAQALLMREMQFDKLAK